MNKFFTILFFSLTLIFIQNVLSESTKCCSYTSLQEDFLVKEIIPQITSNKSITVENFDGNNILIVFYEGKLKIYSMDLLLKAHLEIQEIFNKANKNDPSEIFSNSNDPIFNTPIIDLKEMYYSNMENCFMNATESIKILDGFIRSPHVIFKAKEMEVVSFLIGTQVIELQSNSIVSMISSIKFTLKDKTNSEYAPIIFCDIDFDDNFGVIMCISVNRLEIECSPDSFYCDNGTICFDSKK